jgi:sarcosine oxidase subunit gamma
MVDVVLTRRTALDGRTLASPADRAVAVEAVPPRRRFIIRGRPAVVATAAGALGFPLPTAACRAVVAADVAALWLGPDEWLVIAPEVAGESLGRDLAVALAGTPHALVDVSHRNAAVTVSGPMAAYALNHGCPLDLDLAAFPVGMCTRTLVGRTEAILWRTGETAFHVEVWRSFCDYLVGFLDEARRELA